MLSKNLTKFRTRKKLSKAELGRSAGLSYRTIEFIENGKMNNPTWKTLHGLAKALNVTEQDLMK